MKRDAARSVSVCAAYSGQSTGHYLSTPPAASRRLSYTSTTLLSSSTELASTIKVLIISLLLLHYYAVHGKRDKTVECPSVCLSVPSINSSSGGR